MTLLGAIPRLRTSQAAQQAAVVALVQGAALMATLSVYARVDWPDATAAAGARDQVLALIDAQIDAAAAAGADDLYLAWQVIEGLAVADLIGRAQALPRRITYRLDEAMPSLVLAQRWYQDPAQAEALELLNDAPHPLFMPPVGTRLTR